MDREGLEKLRSEYDRNRVRKNTIQPLLNEYNKDNPTEKIKGCMCTHAKRRIAAQIILEYYEG